MRPPNPLPHEGALTRRALLWIAAPLAFTKQHAAPAQASTAPSTIAGQIRGKGDTISSFGQASSTDCAWAVQPPPLASELLLPDWLVGRWRVKSKLDGVSLPLGRKYITELMPGARMASILSLPNVGNAPNFELTFVAAEGAGGGAARPLRGANTRRLFEAFCWRSRTRASAARARSCNEHCATYADVQCYLKHAGQTELICHVKSGVLQGCPASGILFVVALSPILELFSMAT